MEGFGGAGGAASFFRWRLLTAFTRQNTAKAMMRKFSTALRKLPTMTSPPPGTVKDRLDRALLPPAKMPRMGLMMSLTRELVMALKAPPMMTPTARSRTLPRAMNCLNSAIKPLVLDIGRFAFLAWFPGPGRAVGDNL